jgi:ABC-type Fe3+ transport system substrate-binding protein
VAITSDTHVVGYNKKLISANNVPTQWEDFLKPEFKGKKFCVDIRPLTLSALVPVWGLEKVLDHARKIAAQEPVWVRGNPRPLTVIAAGEHALYMGPNFGAIKVLQSKAAHVDLDYKVIEPVPVRLNQRNAVLATSEHPYTALLWIEFLLSPEAQKTIDKHEPGEASLFGPGSVQSDLIRGKKVSVVQWDSFDKIDGWQKEIVKAYGFPRAEMK